MSDGENINVVKRQLKQERLRHTRFVREVGWALDRIEAKLDKLQRRAEALEWLQQQTKEKSKRKK